MEDNDLFCLMKALLRQFDMAFSNYTEDFIGISADPRKNCCSLFSYTKARGANVETF